MKRVYVNLKDPEHVFFERVARERGLSLSAFFRQAGLEKAVGREMDQSTSELVVEIQALKALVSKRNQHVENVNKILTTVAGTNVGGVPEEKVREKVLGILSQSPPLRLSEVARASGYPEAIVLLIMSKLVEEGFVTLDKRTLHYTMGR